MMAAPAVEPRVIDAFNEPRRIIEGCQHRLGCRCDTPFWLRKESPAELLRFQKPRKAVGGDI